MSDLLIRDVLVIDGTGESPYQGDVSVRAGRIEAVGKLVLTALRSLMVAA